jgi:hypothetical protein
MSVVLLIKMDVDTASGSYDEVTQNAFPMEGAYRMLELPTLQWKIWLKDAENKQAAGLYLFGAREAAEGYAKQAQVVLGQRQGIKNVTYQIWTIDEERTKVTKGPIYLPLIKNG